MISKLSLPVRPSDCCVLAFLEHQRQHAHADQVRAVNALEALGDHRLHAQQHRAFRRPVARRAGAVFLAGQDDQRRAFLLVAHGRVVNAHLLAARHVHGHAAFGARSQLIAQTNVCKRAAHHHFMIATTRAVRVEVGRLHAQRHEILRRRARLGNVTGRRDVIRRHRVAEHRERASAANVRHRAGLHGHADEVGRILHVGRLVVPRVDLAARRVDRVPVLVAREHAGVALLEHRRVHRLRDELLDLGRRRPDVLQVHRLDRRCPCRAARS